ncbi:MAG: hypothetical protein H8E66_20405 [Planctomycetes bacterium]|nr:hypothetical protein [Planctomycetota bacterium]
MEIMNRWRKEPGARLQGSRPLDSSKVQAPCIVRVPAGGYRLFYTAVGPAKPFATCQGYILSAFSQDGLEFQTEPGIRLAPQPALRHMALRVLAPTIVQCGDGRWRMYFESRGSANRPTVICSAVSDDMLQWEHEDGIRLQGFAGVGGPRLLALTNDRCRLYCFASEFLSETGGQADRRSSQSVVSTVSPDGLNFEFEPSYRMRDKQADYDTAGITAAEVIRPRASGEDWTMFYSAWQDAPAGTVVPPHPSLDRDAATAGVSVDFATASIASDVAGYRSRIYVASSPDGLTWQRGDCVIEGAGYGGEGIDAVHAEDMSLVEIDTGEYRMYYAACDRAGNWRIASAVRNSGQ